MIMLSEALPFAREDITVQSVAVGPVTVDTGNDWLDFGFAVALLVIIALISWLLKKGRG